MKIALKTSENHSKVSENHSNRVNFTFWGSSQRDSSFVSSCPSVRSPLKWVIFTPFGVIFTHFGMIFTRFESDFHSVRVFLTLLNLLKSNHFTLFTLREQLKCHFKGFVLSFYHIFCLDLEHRFSEKNGLDLEWLTLWFWLEYSKIFHRGDVDFKWVA